MSTKRTPLNRPCVAFTPRTIAIFTRMVQADCESESEEYDRLGQELRHELRLTTAEGYPPIVYPWHEPMRDALGPAGQWERYKGPRLFRELCAASGIDPNEFGEEVTEEV
jgi:hypothetical protein